MARPPKLSVRFFLRADDLGYIKARISYDRQLYTGNTKIMVPKEDFNYLNSDGTIKNPSNPYRPKAYGDIDLSELLLLYADIIGKHLNDRIASGKPLEREYIRNLLDYAGDTFGRQWTLFPLKFYDMQNLPEWQGKDRALKRYLKKNWRDYFNPLDKWEEGSHEK